MPIEIQLIVAMTLAMTWLLVVLVILMNIDNWLFDRWLERRYKK
nr:MAG TPA: hypothetical protein [Caudoviricetes sp.]